MKLSILFGAVFCCVAALASPAAEPTSSAQEAQLLSDALKEPSPAKRAAVATQILANSDNGKAALQILSDALEELAASPEAYRAAVLQTMDAAAAHPGRSILVLTALKHAENAGLSRKSRKDVLSAAVSSVEDVKKLSPQERAAFSILAMVQAAQDAQERRFERSAQLYEKLLAITPDDKALLQSAIQFFGKASRYAPDSRRMLFLRQSERSEYSEALNAILKRCAASNDPATQLLPLPYFVAYQMAPQARALLEKDLAQDKNRPTPSAELERARLEAALGNYAVALDLLDNAILKPQLPQSSAFRGMAAEWAVRAGQNERALQLLSAPDAKNSVHDTLTEFTRATVLLRLRRYAEAETAADTIELMDLQLFIKVASLCSQGQDSDAIALLDAYAKAHPGELDPEFYRLYALPIEHGRMIGELQKLLDIFRAKGYLKQPGNANDIAFLMTTLDFGLGEANDLLEFALSEEPDNSVILDSMAFLRFRQNRLDEAKQYILRAIDELKEKDDNDSRFVLYDHAGDIFWAAYDFDRAAEYYEKAINLNPPPSPWIVHGDPKGKLVRLRSEQK